MEWTEYFDLVVVLGNKPAFLIDERLSFYQVNPDTSGEASMLDGTHSTITNIEYFPSRKEDVPGFLAKYGKFYQGGNAQQLQMLLNIPNGDSILYVGDHIYSDVLRAKRTLGWRTCLIVPELSKEIVTYNTMRPDREALRGLRRQQDMLETQLDVIYRRNLLQRLSTATSTSDLTTTADQQQEELNIQVELEILKVEIDQRFKAYDTAFHPKWGQLLKAGFRESRISMQIKDFACLFTSRASNLGLTGPQRPFRPSKDFMPHDYAVREL